MADNNSKKRKAMKVPIKEKIRALKLLDSGSTVVEVATELNVHFSTIHKWKGKRNAMEKWMRSKGRDDSELGKMSRMRMPGNDGLDEAVFTWYTQNRDKGVAVTGPMIQCKAIDFNEKLGREKTFVASNGWLGRWKNRYGIQLTNSPDKVSTDISNASQFADNLMELVRNEGLTKDQIFKCDETGLCFKTLPANNSAHRDDKEPPTYNKLADRVTVLICSNASGTLKLPLTVIGKSARPLALRHMNFKNLPVYYTHQQNAWIDSDMFQDWFNNVFVPTVREFLTQKGLPMNARLLVENPPINCPEESLQRSDIGAIFLPPNVAPLLQSPGPVVIENLKLNYRKKLVASIIDAEKYGTDIIEHSKSITTKKVIFWIADAWDELTAFSISRSWNRLWKLPDRDGVELSQVLKAEYDALIGQVYTKLTRIPEYKNYAQSDVKDWLEKDFIREGLSDDEILSQIVARGDLSIDDGSSEPQFHEVKEETTSLNEGVSAANRLIHVIESLDMTEAGISRSDLAVVENIRRRLEMLMGMEGVNDD